MGFYVFIDHILLNYVSSQCIGLCDWDGKDVWVDKCDLVIDKCGIPELLVPLVGVFSAIGIHELFLCFGDSSKSNFVKFHFHLGLRQMKSG